MSDTMFRFWLRFLAVVISCAGIIAVAMMLKRET
jgi:hypothetical protein